MKREMDDSADRRECLSIPAVGLYRHLSAEVGDCVARQRDSVDEVISTSPEVGVAGVRARAQMTKAALIYRVVYTQTTIM